MKNKCLKITDYEVLKQYEHLMRYVQSWMAFRAMELKQSGCVDGFPDGLGNLLGADVSVYEEGEGYLKTTVYHITKISKKPV